MFSQRKKLWWMVFTAANAQITKTWEFFPRELPIFGHFVLYMSSINSCDRHEANY